MSKTIEDLVKHVEAFESFSNRINDHLKLILLRKKKDRTEEEEREVENAKDVPERFSYSEKEWNDAFAAYKRYVRESRAMTTTKKSEQVELNKLFQRSLVFVEAVRQAPKLAGGTKTGKKPSNGGSRGGFDKLLVVKSPYIELARFVLKDAGLKQKTIEDNFPLLLSGVAKRVTLQNIFWLFYNNHREGTKGGKTIALDANFKRILGESPTNVSFYRGEKSKKQETVMISEGSILDVAQANGFDPEGFALVSYSKITAAATIKEAVPELDGLYLNVAGRTLPVSTVFESSDDLKGWRDALAKSDEAAEGATAPSPLDVALEFAGVRSEKDLSPVLYLNVLAETELRRLHGYLAEAQKKVAA